jgi:hypothetical protein
MKSNWNKKSFNDCVTPFSYWNVTILIIDQEALPLVLLRENKLVSTAMEI